MACVLTLALVLSAQIVNRGAEQPAELSSESWRAHPRIKAIEERVAQLDKAAGKPRAVTNVCQTSHARIDADGFVAETIAAVPPPPAQPNIKAKATAPATTMRQTARHRLSMPSDPDVVPRTDFTVSLYTIDGKPRFVLIAGTDRAQRVVEREVRIYFDDTGAPFWSVVSSGAGDDRTEVTRAGAPGAASWGDAPPSFDVIGLWSRVFDQHRAWPACLPYEADHVAEGELTPAMARKFAK